MIPLTLGVIIVFISLIIAVLTLFEPEFSKPIFISSLISFTLFYLLAFLPAKTKTVENTYTVSIKDNVAFIFHDEEFVNLNEKFNRNIEDGTEVDDVTHSNGFYYWNVYRIKEKE